MFGPRTHRPPWARPSCTQRRRCSDWPAAGRLLQSWPAHRPVSACAGEQMCALSGSTACRGVAPSRHLLLLPPIALGSGPLCRLQHPPDVNDGLGVGPEAPHILVKLQKKGTGRGGWIGFGGRRRASCTEMRQELAAHLRVDRNVSIRKTPVNLCIEPCVAEVLQGDVQVCLEVRNLSLLGSALRGPATAAECERPQQLKQLQLVWCIYMQAGTHRGRQAAWASNKQARHLTRGRRRTQQQGSLLQQLGCRPAGDIRMGQAVTTAQARARSLAKHTLRCPGAHLDR